MRRGTLLLIALVLSGLTNVFMLYVQLALIFHVFILTHTARWSDVLSWFGTAASVIIVLAAISDKPITQHNRAIKVIGLIVVCLAIFAFIVNRIYIVTETHQFY